jgi:hypothetical protein
LKPLAGEKLMMFSGNFHLEIGRIAVGIPVTFDGLLISELLKKVTIGALLWLDELRFETPRT